MKIFITVEMDEKCSCGRCEAAKTAVATVFGTPAQVIPILLDMLRVAGVSKKDLTDIVNDDTLPSTVALPLG